MNEKLYIIQDEWYPVYSLTTKDHYYSIPIKLTKKKQEWIENTFEEFAKVQDFLEEKWGKDNE